jgi:hypothetical protein
MIKSMTCLIVLEKRQANKRSLKKRERGSHAVRQAG